MGRPGLTCTSNFTTFSVLLQTFQHLFFICFFTYNFVKCSFSEGCHSLVIKCSFIANMSTCSSNLLIPEPYNITLYRHLSKSTLKLAWKNWILSLCCNKTLFVWPKVILAGNMEYRDKLGAKGQMGVIAKCYSTDIFYFEIPKTDFMAIIFF